MRLDLTETDLIRLLSREDEVTEARLPSGRRKEGLQNMRESYDLFEARSATTPCPAGQASPGSMGGGAAQLAEAVAVQEAMMKVFREQEFTDDAGTARPDSCQAVARERVDLIDPSDPTTDPDVIGPAGVARLLCDKATHTREQKGPVTLIAQLMHKQWIAETKRRASLTDAQRAQEITALGGAAQHSRLPLAPRACRILIFGGGGCGKTRIITDVLTPLFKTFYGPAGCVLTAFSNKAARLVGGKTC